jgi:phosphatidylserine/phosphatidylglycerophosphate/cardiolipin synthase-like enzyme/uncharacterized membrane protein YdjX (TVP38/TMEM64 family)
MLPVRVAASASDTLLRAGVNCWRIAHADRIALLVDGEDYFEAFAAAAERARRSVIILAWDFNSRTQLRCDPPLAVGDFLNSLARRRRGLDVRILIWDYPMIFGTDREFPSVYGLGWKAHRRVRVRYDNTHPVAGCHHQKVVVIDDAVAFSGGLDLTCRRWDTRDHRPDDERRCDNGDSYPPFHDVMAMVDGDAARALGDLARERWYRATGRRLPRVDAPRHAWPEAVPVAMRDAGVAISRTQPPRNGTDAVREIETMYADMIGAARSLIYIENQYFTSHVVAEKLEQRLAEADGPEVVIVLRFLSHGWLEEVTMHSLRKALIARLHAADHHGRLRVYYPHIDGLAEGTCIDVHSKVMIVDDEWLHVGSANICNRSMGFDTECDLTIEARGREDLADAIVAFRHRLLGEHLGVGPERVAGAVREHGSVRAAVEKLREPGRTLEPLAEEPEASDTLTTLASLADLEQPVTIDRLITQFAPRGEPSHARAFWLKLAGIAALLAALTAMWHYTPLASWITADRITGWARRFADEPWAPLAVLAAYTPAAIVMFPRALITLFAVVAFGPWVGFTLAMTGVLLAALLTYVAGTRLDRSTVRRLSGSRLERIIRVLRERGLVAITALRLVPLAPFAVEGAIAGAIRINRLDFMLGTALGMLPGTLAATVFGDQLEAALRNPADVNVWLLGGVLIGLLGATLYVRRWLMTTTLRG